jgi:hypothetical protein
MRLLDTYLDHLNPWGQGPKTPPHKCVTRRADIAVGILRFIAAFAMFVMLYGIFNTFIPDWFTSSQFPQAESTQLQTTQGYFEFLWQGLPFIFVIILGIFLLSRAAFESRGGI